MGNSDFLKLNWFLKIFVIGVISLIVIFLAWTYLDYKLYNYIDFIPSASTKPTIFKDSIRPSLIAYTSKCNSDDDTLFYFNYEEKYWLLYWSSGHYQNLSMKDIIVMKDKEFCSKDLNSYFYYSLGSNCPIKIGANAKIEDKGKIILGFNKCQEMQMYNLSPNSMTYNLKCSEIGIGSLSGYFDFDIAVNKSTHLTNLFLYKSFNRLHIIFMISIKDEDIKIEDLLQLLNMK